MFEVLLLGLGDEVLGAETEDARLRHLRYAESVDHLHLVVWSQQSSTPVSLSPKLTVYPVGQGGRWAFMREATQVGERLIGERKIRVVSTQEPFYTGLVGLWLKRLGPRLQIQNHSDFIDNRLWIAERPLWNSLLNIFGKWAVRRADHLRVVNSTERQKYIRLGIPVERVDVIPVPVDLSAFGQPVEPARLESLRQRWNISPAAQILFWVGRPVPFKDVGTLLRAVALLHPHWPELCLVLGGNFPASSPWPTLVSDLNLQDVVRFVGPISRSELPDYYALCSVYVHSSMYEGFGRVMLEASASARAVVATDTAGARDIIADGQTGLLCEPRTPAALAETIATLLKDPDRAWQMGRAGQHRARKVFDPEQLTQAIRQAWHKCAGSNL
jgi:glycosyltransferase involved in cell wall biosynthesis